MRGSRIYKGKIFNLGLSRTGTRSLIVALRILGYSARHYPFYPLSAAVKHDALGDITVLAEADEIIKIYPEAKYIITKRNKDEWLLAVVNFFSRAREHKYHPNLFTVLFLYRKIIYGSRWPTKEQFSKAYDYQYERINKLVDGLDYCIMNICEGDGWEILSPFLGAEIPDVKFPHLHNHNRKKSNKNS